MTPPRIHVDATDANAPTLAVLPLFAQSLVAGRLARRAVLAMLDGEERLLALEACDVVESIARRGDGWSASLVVPARLRKHRRTRENEAALEAVRWAFDAAGAAQGALDFPVDALVTASAQRSISAVCDDARVSSIQVTIIVQSDVDLIGFACGESNVRTYDGVGEHVIGRLPPCHAITLSTPRWSVEDEAR